MDGNTPIPVDYVIKLFGTLLAFFSALCAFVVGFVKMLHGGMVKTQEKNSEAVTKSLEKIHTDLQPISIQIAIHTEKINKLEEGHVEQLKWLNNHDTRIQAIERKIPVK